VLDVNPKSILGERFVALIDGAIDRNANNERRRDYLGGSAIGEPCARRLQYEYLGAPKDEGAGFSPRVRRIFRRGHESEEWMIGWMRDAGFDLRTRGKDGRQFGFEDCDGRFRGHFDGVIVGGPDGFKYPALFEAKCLGDKGWRQLSRHGVAKAYPHYAAQVAIYQAYGQLAENPAFFVALNANDMAIHCELVPFNQQLAQESIDKAARILTACDHGETLPRIAAERDSFACRFCPFQEVCWDE